MISYNINLFNFLAEREGFGINTDLFDTNILNLAVVIGVLVYYGKSICLVNLFLLKFLGIIQFDLFYKIEFLYNY